MNDVGTQARRHAGTKGNRAPVLRASVASCLSASAVPSCLRVSALSASALRASLRPAFSLVEMMIALIVLGLGLLFIAAALPVGVDYTRQSLDLATANAAGEQAATLLEMNLRTSHGLEFRPGGLTPPANFLRLDSIFRPRRAATLADPLLPQVTVPNLPVAVINPPMPNLPVGIPAYEPLFKVRPLTMANISMNAPGVSTGQSPRGQEVIDYAENAISAYFVAQGGVPAPPNTNRELEFFPGDTRSLAYQTASGFRPNLQFPSVARVFPPIEPDMPFRAKDFLNEIVSTNQFPPPRPVHSRSTMPVGSETGEAIDRRIGWTAFYRRVAYDKFTPGFDGVLGNADDEPIESDPLLYEVIIVVTRRPSANHRFALQDVTTAQTNATFEQPTAVDPSNTTQNASPFGADRLLPTPWLVLFDLDAPGPTWPPNPANPPALPELNPATDYFPQTSATGADGSRPLQPGFVDPPQLSFRCKPQVGRLLPVGSVFIPALNDSRPDRNTPIGRARSTGFVPNSPDSLPIYEVIEVHQAATWWTVTVKNNGFYPWLDRAATNTTAWPVWIIPPSFSERAGGQPVYDRHSPILSVTRRYVRLPEIE